MLRRSLVGEQVVIGKQVPINTRDPVANLNIARDYKPQWTKWKGSVGEKCVVDRVLVTNNEATDKVVKVLPEPLQENQFSFS